MSDSEAEAAANRPRSTEPRFDIDEAREASLQRELDGVRNINAVLEGVVSSLERAKGNMETVSRTVNSASTLLNTWVRILSQTEHNQRLILDPSWQGASQDLADIENEAILKRQAAERKEAAEKQRREDAARKAELEEKRRTNPTVSRGTRGLRSRGRAAVTSATTTASSTRGSGSTSRGYVGVGGQGGLRGTNRGRVGLGTGIGAGRAASGIGRGIGAARGRGPGTR
ncbi:MAG: hypothetical protein M1825_005357 [Sarcosagium campestre]|nr:MAG: hypothetical protein M1825_005357 [Sarcosagium campestre]